MSKETLMDAISHMDLELIEKYFKKKRNGAKEKRVYWYWKKYSAVAAVFCVLISSILLMVLVMKKPKQPNEFTLPVDEQYIAWLSDDTIVYDSDTSKTKWEGLSVSENLYSILQSVDNDIYMAVIVRNDDESLVNQFQYEGKKYEEYQKEYEELTNLAIKLEAIMKEGDYLKYGEALYIEGAPDGTKWTEEYYNERVEFYGSGLLDKYIKDGEFLLVDVEKDIVVTEENISELIIKKEEVVKAYSTHNMKKMYEVFKEAGYCVTCKNNNLYLFITKKDFSQLDIENVEIYDFYLASLSGYKGEIKSKDSIDAAPSITDTVTGFDISKIYFDSIDDENFSIHSDQDIIEGLNQSIGKWKNSYDSLEFTFYFNTEETIKEEWFEGMHYIEIWQFNYPQRIVVQVAYENINVEAIKELSLKKEISSIHISSPSSFESDIEPDVP